MIGYVTIGADDLNFAAAFYDGVFGSNRRRTEAAGERLDRVRPQGGRRSRVGICKPQNGEAARSGNGIMVAFSAASHDEVDDAFGAGLAHGGVSEGAPGYRPPEGNAFYGCYLRDPTGNKICNSHE